ncbi:hypothetical protein, partial [Rhodoferax sp.]|uniref:hypothetical protein n=1 Tax=Rhodoferax sp. TaxID=50421 RepID=UPI002633B72B
ALAVACHREDITFGLLQKLFPGPDGEVWIDFTTSDTLAACPRHGMALYLRALYQRFCQRYVLLQNKALANGRFFPPPSVLRVRLAALGSIRVDTGFAPGFLPGERLYVVVPSERGHKGQTWLLKPDEAIPQHHGVREWLAECAKHLVPPGLELRHIGSVLWSVDCLALGLTEGAELTARIEDQFCVGLFWRCHRLGNAWRNLAELRTLLTSGQPLRIRVVRLDFLNHLEMGSLAYAVYA